ncbi:tetratricopeptide repeat protein [Candidatus Symbiobacter mobilis]|uniref:tetratricopeptide repeat protein n=1 Tax=Candidatus Symbiobacter mobilis TaxID=1436290 RepID=UPI0016519995|nr:tetratricopeptide repeat protein [Candidatus Symbiobacter mobilis]
MTLSVAHADPSAKQERVADGDVEIVVDDSPEGAAEVPLDGPLFYQLLLGEMQARSSNPAAAFSLLLDAARQTKDERLYRRAVQVAIHARKGESALMAVRAWRSAHPSSHEAVRTLLHVLIQLHRVEESLPVLRRDLALTPPKNMGSALTGIPRLYKPCTDRLAVARVIHKAYTPWLEHPQWGPDAWAGVAEAWLRAGEPRTALDAARRALADGDAGTADHAMIVALALVAIKDPQADALVRERLAVDDRPILHRAYVRVLFDAQREQDAVAALQNMVRRFPDDAQGRWMLGMWYAEHRQFDDAHVLLLQYLKLVGVLTGAEPVQQRESAQALLALGTIALSRKEYDQAQTWLQRVGDGGLWFDAQRLRAQALVGQQGLDAALAWLRDLAVQSPDHARQIRGVEAQLLRKHRRYVQARDLLDDMIAQEPGDVTLLVEMAIVLDKMGAVQEMERRLRQGLADHPEEPLLYNALGYALADRNLRLDEAHALIVRALELAPGDPYISDSLGWVEFRQGKLEQAEQHLREAFGRKPEAEIAAHWGEVLWTLGRREEALDVWRKGLALDAEGEVLLETLRRLGVQP